MMITSRLKHRCGPLVWMRIGGIATVAVLALAGSPVLAGDMSLLDSGVVDCESVVEQSSRPALLLLGEATEIATTIRGACEGEMTTHMVVVIDGSSERSVSIDEAASLARAFTSSADLGVVPERRLGIVAFAEDQVIRCELGDRADVLLGCIDAPAFRLNNSWDWAIGEGHRMLDDARGLAVDPREFLVLITMRSIEDCNSMLGAIQSAREDGVRVYAVAAATESESCMAKAASNRSYYFESRGTSGLARIARDIVEDAFESMARSLVLTVELPADMQYISGSARPEAELDESGKVLTWRIGRLANEAQTLRFEVRPGRPGFQRGIERMNLEAVDPWDRPSRAELQPAWLQVFAAVVLPRP